MSDALLFAGVLALTLVLGPALIRALRGLRLRQQAYEDAPSTFAMPRSFASTIAACAPVRCAIAVATPAGSSGPNTIVRSKGGSVPV